MPAIHNRVVPLLLALLFCGAVFSPSSSSAADAGVLPLEKGDRICLIGNALAERFQYFGSFETLLQKQFPDKQLVVRNLGYAGDEVRFRPRSLDFGTPDQHLTLRQADVILAFFGFNESFAGRKGLPAFQRELAHFVDHTLRQRYNGKSAPRLVLFSPIAHEDIGNPNLPDGRDNNRNIQLYADAMAAVAAEKGVACVDLFTATQELYAAADERLTINGIHLNESGCRQVGAVMMQALFGRRVNWTSDLARLDEEVLEKNFNIFHDYRAVNGFYIYGGRSRRDHGNPPYTDAHVIENERAKLREMAAICDQRIWDTAAGRTPRLLDYSQTRKLYDVPTNFKQPVGIKSPEEAMKHFTIAKGYEVNLFASEREFPELQNPVNFTFDAQGRLWVATMPSYPQYQPPNKPDDKLLILEDTDRDGKADKLTVFADKLHLPTGFELGDGGAYVAQEPNLMFLKDTDGDGKADLRKLVLHGFDSADSHHAIGAFTWGPGGGIYMHEGTFHHTQVETPYGPIRNAHGAVYRFDPTRHKFETFVSYNFANPWGQCFDRWGQNFVADASGGANYFGTAFSTRPHPFTGQEDFGPFKFAYQEKLEQFFPKRVRPTAGCELVSSRHFPPEAQGNYLLNNCIGFQGVLQHTVKEEGSGFVGQEIEPILFSSDRNFRPTDLQFGPDGALYIVDWFNPLVGHMQHSLRDPNRDHAHGRIWRVTYPSRPLVQPPQIEGQPIAALLELLKTHEDRTRYRVRLKLREFPAKDIATEVERWVEGLDRDDPEYLHHKLEALWVCQHHNLVTAYSVDLLTDLLKSPDHRARAAATRVVSYWRDRLPSSLGLSLLRASANDQHPRVRLEAVRAASWFDDAEAAEIALETLKHPSDYYIDYALRHTIRRLEEFWKPAVGSGKEFAKGNAQAIDYIVSRVSTPDLINMTRSESVYREMLARHGIVHSYRHEALQGLASLHKTDALQELLAAVDRLDKSPMEHAQHVLADMTHMFTMQEPATLASRRGEIDELAKNARKPITRRVATVALITADQSADKVWNGALASAGDLRNLLDTVPLIPDDNVRRGLYDRIAPLVTRLPEPLASRLQGFRGASGRFVRIELRGAKRTLTLAEVEVMSGGENVARRGTATQSTFTFSGRAPRAIDGNTSPVYANEGQTHTHVQKDPWWEVDLGAEFPIESIVIYNRNEDGKYADRLDGFILTVFDNNREVVFRKGGNKAPASRGTFTLKGNPRKKIHAAAITALSYIPGRDATTFRALAPLVAGAAYRTPAVQSLARLKVGDVPQDEIRPVLDELLKYIESVPGEQRTQTEVMDAIQLGKDLSGFLAKEEAIAVRRQLAELAVDVIVIRPVPHRMQYDRPQIYVVADKLVEIVFENLDIMPHNLVVTAPGAREEVGILAERMGATPDGFARQFIPDSVKVLHATRMLQPGEEQRIQLKAPTAIGEYPFVCTFPGHWRTMHGMMHVVADISEIPLQPTDPAPADVPVRQFVRKWSVDDLLRSESELHTGRDFENGVRLFKAISCVACHSMKGQGGKLAPELADVPKKLRDGKLNMPALIESLVVPSKVIEPKYRTQIIFDDDGKPYSGVVVYEDEQVVRLAANPLDKTAKVVEIAKDTIDERAESKVSIMPEGLLNTMTKSEILDLIAYLLSAGDPKHASFQP